MKPPARFDPVVPFWFWNGRMQPEEVIGQIREMKKAGLDAFFVHPRFGMTIPYLGVAYFRLLRQVVEECRKLDMRAWLYDEYPFPSGVGGGELISDPANWLQTLEIVEHGEPYGASITGGPLLSRDGIRYYAQYGHCDAFVYGCEPNYFNPSLFARFQSQVLDRYASELGDALGSVIPGIFTDEPKINSISHTRPSSKTIPWWDGIESDYRQSTGRSLLDDLWVFSSRGPAVSAIRARFWSFVADAYIARWFRPYRSWCDSHRLILTGHLFLEEGLYANTIYQGDFPRVMAELALPGVDYLTRETDGDYGLDGYPRSITKTTGPKLTHGVVLSRGGKDMLSETFGCAGWNMSSADMKRITDWLIQLGVTVFCPHALFYTVRGPIKNDAPPSHFTQNPIWLGYPAYKDYVAAVLREIRSSKYPVDEILLYPREYFVARFIPGEVQPELTAFHLRFERTCRGLFERGCNFTVIPAGAVDGLPPARLWVDELARDDYAHLLQSTAHSIVSYTDANLDQLLESASPKGTVTKAPGQNVTMTRWHDADGRHPLWFVANGTSLPQGIRIGEPCEVEDVFGARSAVESAGPLELAPFQSVIIRPAAAGTVAPVRRVGEALKVEGGEISMKASRAVQRLVEWRVRAENNGRRRHITLSSSFTARGGCRVFWAREDVRAGSERAAVWINDRSVSLADGLSLLGDPEISFFDVTAVARDGSNCVRVELNEDPWVNRESGSICDSWVIHEGSEPVGEPLLSNVTIM